MQQRYWAKYAENKDFNNMISENNMEEVAIYDCSKVGELRDALGWKTEIAYNPGAPVSQNYAPLPTYKNCFAENRDLFIDMRSYVSDHKPPAKDALDKVMLYHTSNEQFGVNWPINNKGTPAKATSHGLLIHQASYFGVY